mmetsp:Transcript_63174/g.175187  ORF Transcript_63174/g.175187 Transcript_63174/m.175187 type:complete len:258 (-) Transcript_63174:1443-2216(-)
MISMVLEESLEASHVAHLGRFKQHRKALNKQMQLRSSDAATTPVCLSAFCSICLATDSALSAALVAMTTASSPLGTASLSSMDSSTSFPLGALEDETSMSTVAGFEVVSFVAAGSLARLGQACDAGRRGHIASVLPSPWTSRLKLLAGMPASLLRTATGQSAQAYRTRLATPVAGASSNTESPEIMVEKGGIHTSPTCTSKPAPVQYTGRTGVGQCMLVFRTSPPPPRVLKQMPTQPGRSHHTFVAVGPDQTAHSSL